MSLKGPAFDKQREYAKVSSMAFRSGAIAFGVAAIFGLGSLFTAYDFEFTAIMVGLFAIMLFLVANYAATVATSR